MRKMIGMLLALILCFTLCACSAADVLPSKPEEIVLPTRPEALEVPSQPLPENTADSTETDAESTEAASPTGETNPWDVEFIEEDYDVFQFPGQISYRIGGIFGREVRNIETLSNGYIFDAYYYPSGNVSHCYTYAPDGTFLEAHCLDNGYVDENGTSYSGVCIYQKTVNPDGSWDDTHWDENGTIIRTTFMGTDGTYQEIHYFENGIPRLTISSNLSNKSRYETECYENGNIKYSRIETTQLIQEDHYDEEGYSTYFYIKGSGPETELIADSTGKLIKAIINGEVKEDAETLAQYVRPYNFRS